MADKQARYEIRADVKGRESITGLADDLDNVSKVLGGDLSRQAQAAAAQLRELAEQDAAITAFTQLQAVARDTGKALKAAETEAANYGKQVLAMGPPTAQEAAALQRLQAAAEGTRATFAQQQQAVAAAQGELQRYGVAGQNAQAAQQRLRQEVALMRESVTGLVPAYQGAAAGAQNAGATMNRTHRAIGEGVESISQQLARLQSLYAALQGFQGVKNLATDLAKTADQANNLQARIQLVTGEGKAFTAAWEGVSEVALRTHSALEETGVLFTRLAQAGKDAGLSASAASRQSLALTETINQAIQLSGASAQASSAAITQLVQGLQSGVLRGDEFNSVMEQAPRLAQALANGLGVTTGELRKMAEAGALTSETVIKALRGQSATIAAEFSKLPPTVGRALQDLSTQWTLYVAEADKANGASAATAQAINALSNNLRTLAGLLVDAGQAALAFAALRLAQHFLGLGAAAQGAAVAVAATNAQLAATGPAAAAAASGAGRLAAVLATLRTFTLVGLLANIKDIGTWLGESAAKLAGYKDRTEELERAEKRQAEAAKQAAAERARMAEATQDALDKQFDLSKAARAAVGEFDQLTKKGSTAAEAVKKVSDGFDLGKVQGIRDFSATLDKLTSDGKLSASEFEAAWAQALNGKDLLKFETMARAAFAAASDEARKLQADLSKAINEGAPEAAVQALRDRLQGAMAAARHEGERLEQVFQGTLREAIRRTGLDFDLITTGMGKATASALNDLDVLIRDMDRLGETGANVSQVLAASFKKAIDTADGQKALTDLRSRIEEVRHELGDRVADGLLDQAKEKADALKDALDKATPGISSVREAMKLLGVTSEESLKKTATSFKDAYDTMASDGSRNARELGEAFKKAAEAAIAANKGVAPAWVEANAAVRGYEIEVDKAGKSTLKLKDATDSTAGAHSRAARAINEHRTALERLNAEREREIASQEKANELATRQLQLQEAKRNAGVIKNADGVPSFETKAQADAWLAKWKEQYARDNPFSTKSGGQLGNFMHDMTMFEWNKEVDAMELRNAMKGKGNASESKLTPLDSMRRGDTYVSNITIPGMPGTTQVRYADAESQRASEELLRQLAQAKGSAQ